MKLPETRKTSPFDRFNDELNEFYNYLKSNNYSDEQIRKIFTPIRPDMKLYKNASVIFAFVFLILIGYFATYLESVSWNLSAIGRIFLIKLLPYWDWTVLKNEKCLLSKAPSTPPLENLNCALCEHLQDIDFYEDISEDYLKNRYLDVDLPVIIGETLRTIENFPANLIQDEILAASEPCSLATNLQKSSTNLKHLLARSALFDSFFLHFQNCDFRAMKQFRAFTSKPKFLPRDLSPVQYNWLLWSHDYNVTQFKPLPLVEKYAVVGQIQGGNFFKLKPRKYCEEACPIVQIRLKAGEVLVLSSLWDLEYRPVEMGENIAVIFEMH